MGAKTSSPAQWTSVYSKVTALPLNERTEIYNLYALIREKAHYKYNHECLQEALDTVMPPPVTSMADGAVEYEDAIAAQELMDVGGSHG